MNKNDNNANLAPVDVELPALEKHVLSLSDLVENVFADAIVALMDGDMSAAAQARLEDYKAHQAWLKADSFIVDLLCTGDLQLEQIHFVSGVAQIAQSLKQMADLGINIMSLMQKCPGDRVPEGACSEYLPRMAEVTQSMFSDAMHSFVHRDVQEAHDLHLTHRELKESGKELIDSVNAELRDDENLLEPQAGTAMILVARCLEDMGRHSLDIANSVIRLTGDEERALKQSPQLA